MNKPLITAAAAVAAAACVALPSTAASNGSRDAATAAAKPAAVDSGYALVQLTGAPISTAAATRPQGNGRVKFDSTAVRNERAKLAAARNDFKKWLRANVPAAKVTSEFDLAVNAVGVKLNGVAVDRLRSAPGVAFVEQQGVFHTDAHEDPDLSLVHVQEAWNQIGGPANAGKGVDVAIIDSGIDVSHPCFDDTGYPATQQIGDPDLTNNKVFVSRVYGNKVVKDGLDASDQNGHGTHVAGTVACAAHTPANVDGADIPYDPSGIAPAARLGSYNVFPGTEGSGRSEDILEAMEDAYEDGFDVANMSLGGARNDGGGAFLLDNAVNNLDKANMVVAVAAGNEGPGYFTVHYPGAAERALTAGASTVGHNVVNTLTIAGASYDMVVGEFGELTSDVSGPLDVVPGSSLPHGLSTACNGDPALPNLTGKIALLGRGVCDFTEKMANAQAAGAIAVIMVDHTEEPPFVMAHNGLVPAPTIPGVMVRLSDGAVIDNNEGATATLNALGVYKTYPASTNVMAGFSSQGPTHGDLLIKPDVVAPGADVLSAQPAWTCEEPPCWAFFGGTSMATPHLAGAAAVVRGAHPGWTAEQVRSAVVNTATQGVLKHPTTQALTDDPLIVGAGRLDVGAANTAKAGLSPVSKSFGNWSSGAGGSRNASLVLTNITGASRTYTTAVTDTLADGVTFSTSSVTFTLAAGASRTVTVTATSTKGAAEGHKWATLRLSSGGAEVAHAMLYALVGQGDAAPGQHQLPPPKA